jgi:glutathione S-transferase
MADHTLSILTPSVNNLCARIFVRAAGLDFEEIDVWGKKDQPDFMRKDPALLTPMLEEDGLPKGSLWESCAIMQYLCNKHGLDRFYPTDPGERAMVDSAMFYLTGTLYPLVARATYPALGFPQYAGEVATSDAGRTPRRPLRSRSTSTGPSSSTAGSSSAAPARRSRTSAWPRRSSSCGRSTTTSRPGPRSS